MEEKESPPKDGGEIKGKEQIKPRIYDKVWFARTMTLVMACLRQGNVENAEEALETNISELGFSTDFLNVRMDLQVEGGRAFKIIAFGSDPEIAVLKVRLADQEKLCSPGEVTPEEYAGIRQGVKTAFEKIRSEKLNPNEPHSAVVEIKVSDFVVPRNTQVH